MGWKFENWALSLTNLSFNAQFIKKKKKCYCMCIKPRNIKYQKFKMAAHCYANEVIFDLKSCIFTNVVQYVIIPFYGTKIGSKMTITDFMVSSNLNTNKFLSIIKSRLFCMCYRAPLKQVNRDNIHIFFILIMLRRCY